MPNWCQNILTLSHKDCGKLDEAERAFSEGKLLSYFCPEPTWDKSDSSSWYDWRIGSWGVKWDVGQETWGIYRETRLLTLNFDSAWGPPLESYSRARSAHGFDIEALYMEPAMMFCGEYTNVGGKEQHFEYEVPHGKDHFVGIAPAHVWRPFEAYTEANDNDYLDRIAG